MGEEKNNEKRYDLSERLIEFAVRIIELVEQLPRTLSGKHIGGELLRCGTLQRLITPKHKAPNHEKILFTK